MWSGSFRYQAQKLNIDAINSKLCVLNISKSVCMFDLNVLLPIFCTLKKELSEIHNRVSRKNLCLKTFEVSITKIKNE